jgi:hypothetical protein
MFIATNITPLDEIFKELTDIQAFLDARYQSDTPAACIDRLDELQGYQSRSGKLFADAEYHYNTLLNSEIMASLKLAQSEKMSISTLNKYIESMCKDYKYLYTWAERVNRCCTHHADQMRTVISNHKAERFASR